MKNTIITRQEYMANKVTHREFFGQFVDEEVTKELLNNIYLEELKASKDEHFNDISMKKWDGISGIIFIGGSLMSRPMVRAKLANQLNEAGGGVSPAGLVCVYKEAARQLVRPEQVL